MDRIWIIARKEIRDALRDRRALLSALFFPMFGPLLIALLLFGAAATTDPTTRVGIMDIDPGSAMANSLTEHGLEVVVVEGDPGTIVQSGSVPVVLRRSPDASAGQPAPYDLIIDSTRIRSRVATREVHEALEDHEKQMVEARLAELDIPPSILTPLRIDELDLASATDRAAHLLETLVMFIVVAAFICSMYIAIDTTAGERERHSLEPLLLNPVPPLALVLGKFIATALISALGLTLTTLFVFAIAAQLPLEAVGFELLTGPRIIGGLMVVLLPLALVASAVQLLVASFARSFKEAQTYISLTLVIPVAPGLALTLLPIEPTGWMMTIPALSHQLLARAALRGESIPPLDVVLCQGTTLMVTAACLWLTASLFGRERVLFGD